MVIIMRRLSARAATVGLLAVLAAGCVSSSAPRVTGSAGPGHVSIPSHVRVRLGDRVQSVPLETYVLGAALSEIGPVGETPETVRRVFEVQAILARTYATVHRNRHAAEGFDLCDTTHCQVYQPGRVQTSRFADAARRAVAATRARVLVFAGRPIQALFHADCGGHLAPADAVWGGDPIAYLPGGPDDVSDGTHRAWQFAVPGDALLQALRTDARSDTGSRLDAIHIEARDASGRAETVRLEGDRTRILRGEHFRAIVNLTFGPGAILSTRFDVARTGPGYAFEGTGYGHGVGLCQVGAMARARRGDGVGEILAAYYPGARVE
jgi:stage II sporulation protein D